jgi:hypothetical protein
VLACVRIGDDQACDIASPMMMVITTLITSFWVFTVAVEQMMVFIWVPAVCSN